MTSCREPPTKSNPTIVNQNPQQKINISNIKMISMMKSFSKQQNSEGENPKIVPGTSRPALGTKTIIIEDEAFPTVTTEVSNKTANKQALIEKLLKQQLGRTVNNS